MIEEGVARRRRLIANSLSASLSMATAEELQERIDQALSKVQEHKSLVSEINQLTLLKNAVNDLDMCMSAQAHLSSSVTSVLANQVAALTWNANHTLCSLAILLGRLDPAERSFEVDWKFSSLKERLKSSLSGAWCNLMFDDGKVLSWHGLDFAIGSFVSNNLFADDVRLSGQHCRLTPSKKVGEPPTLTDMSTNGTLVKDENEATSNKLVAASRKLKWGDRIEVVEGEKSLCFVVREPNSQIDPIFSSVKIEDWQTIFSDPHVAAEAETVLGRVLTQQRLEYASVLGRFIRN